VACGHLAEQVVRDDLAESTGHHRQLDLPFRWALAGIDVIQPVADQSQDLNGIPIERVGRHSGDLPDQHSSAPTDGLGLFASRRGGREQLTQKPGPSYLPIALNPYWGDP
jgi:hypothetical protein